MNGAPESINATPVARIAPQLPRVCRQNKFGAENSVCHPAKRALVIRVQVVAGAAFALTRDVGRGDDLGRSASPMPATAVAYKMRNRCLLMSILALASSVMLATSTCAAEAGTTEHEGVSLKPEMLVQFAASELQTRSGDLQSPPASSFFHKSRPAG